MDFYTNLDIYVYKMFLKMVKKLSCMSVNTKCNNCPLKDNC